MRHVYLVTGSCPQTEAEARMAVADAYDEMGEPMRAASWRLVVRKWRRRWADPQERTKAGLKGRIPLRDPDALVAPIGSPEHPMFWHEPRRDDTVVCPCGHFADFLCDTPIGRGKTCDRPMCRCCRTEVGPDLDRCPYHEAER